MSVTIKRRDGSVLFNSDTASSVAEAVAELVAEARLTDPHDIDLRYADLCDTNLSSADLRYADLCDTNLSYADLRSADLSYANLSSADLSYADLRSANLRYADLRSADLCSADLCSADLRSANLRSADLSSADLRSAVGMSGFFQLGPIDNWWMSISLEEPGWRFRAGCRYFSEDEAREHWGKGGEAGDPVHGARMLGGVDALIAIARAHNWPEKLAPKEAATPEPWAEAIEARGATA